MQQQQQLTTTKMDSSKDNSANSANKDVDREIDAELNDLLDDALEDFSSGNEATGVPPTETKKGAGSDGCDPISDMFTEEFSDEMAKQFEEAMQSLMADDPGMLQQIEKLAEAASTAGDSETAQKDFQSTLKDTLNSLAQNTDHLQDAPGAGGGVDGMVPDEMIKMFEGMGMQSGGAEDGFMPMMQTMMKTLLSKEVLYPSLKDIADKYPGWLKDNKDKISESEYSNYSKQHSIIEEILREFEAEKTSDTDDVKNKRHQHIMDKMQKMQELGQPPKDIVGEMAPGLDFDANGVPKFPGSNDACAIM